MPYTDPIFDEKNKVKSQPIKFGAIGDAFKGTLLSKKLVEVTTNEGRKNKIIYEFKSLGGAYHDIDPNTLQAIGDEIVVEPGKTYAIWSRGKKFDDDMRRAKLGYIVAFKYESNTNPKPGKRPGKVVSVFIGGPDPDYMGETADDIAADFGGTVEPGKPKDIPFD